MIDIEMNKIPEKEILKKKDIKEIFECGDQKALCILKLLWQMEYAAKIGKEYYTTHDNLMKFMNESMKKNIYI